MVVNIGTQRIGSAVRVESAGCSEKCTLKLLDNDPEPRFLRAQKEVWVIPLLCGYMRWTVWALQYIFVAVCVCLCLRSYGPLLIRIEFEATEDYAYAHLPVRACVCSPVCISGQSQVQFSIHRHYRC